MNVMKFGGTSVADTPALHRLAGIVAAARRTAREPGPVVVVSALAGVTDALLALAARAAQGDPEGARGLLDQIRERHRALAGAIRDEELRERVAAEIDRELAQVSEIAGALAVLREVSPRWLDAIAAAGEIASSRLVTAVLAGHGIPAAWVDARRAVVTDGAHTAAAPLLGETEAAARREISGLLAAGRVPVLGGFVGATSEGVTTTLGRGGSDYSASILGACLGASEIQIWTDVDGMLTADPRLVEEPEAVPRLSFAEASELAYFGAKVLHPSTILPAIAREIPVRILNARRPAAAGTLITASRAPGPRPLTAIASKGGVTVVDITSTRMLMAHGFLRRLFEAFERHATAVDVVTTSEVSVSVTVDDPRRLPEIVEALSGFAEVSCEPGMAIVCVVGDGLQADPRLVADVLSALDGVPLRMVSQAASRRNLTFVIRETDLATSLFRIHERYFAAAPAPLGVEA
jgi:aspartate kinase